MLKLVIGSFVLSLVACATTTRTLDIDGASSRATARLDLGIVGDASQFPKAIDPQLPGVDRIGTRVRAALGETAKARVQLCVAPTGKVTKVELVESSSFEAFDAALLRDAHAWQFAAIPGPESLQTCSQALVSYRPY